MTSAPACEFRAADHTYWCGGRQLVGVTSVLSACNLVPGAEFFTEGARQRGTATHMACWYDDQGQLDEASVAPVVRPRLEAWRRFRADLPEWELVAIEEPMFSGALGLAGTPDRLFRSKGRLLIPDIKTAALEAPWWPLQGAGYGLLAEEVHGIARHLIRRLTVRLLEDGTYRLREYTDRRDYDRFRAALAVAQMQQEFGTWKAPN